MAWLEELAEEEPPEPEKPIGKVVIGNLEPDMHVAAKELVRRALKAAGFKTIDLGGGVPAGDFAKRAKEANANVIAVSINTNMALDNLQSLVSAIDAEGLKGKVILMLGGSVVKKEDADAIGALYGRNKTEAVELVLQCFGQK